jgi:SAM-dependent methyltransferase
MADPGIDEGEQAQLWNGVGAKGWVELEGLMDRLFRPVEEVLVEAVVAAAPPAGARVLDVGCGTGATTVAIARTLGPGASCTGLDVSEPMLGAARARAAREGLDVRFVRADAQRHVVDPGGVDVVASRFGVMFFDDPVAAFANLRRATADGGSLRAVVWRSAEDNPFMSVADEAAATVVEVPPRPVEGPGAFALADPDGTRALLGRAGWSAVELTPLDLDCSMPEADLPDYATRIGPLGRALAEADDATRQRAAEVAVPAYERFVRAGRVHLPVACWLVRATA